MKVIGMCTGLPELQQILPYAMQKENIFQPNSKTIKTMLSMLGKQLMTSYEKIITKMLSMKINYLENSSLDERNKRGF